MSAGSAPSISQVLLPQPVSGLGFARAAGIGSVESPVIRSRVSRKSRSWNRPRVSSLVPMNAAADPSTATSSRAFQTNSAAHEPGVVARVDDREPASEIAIAGEARSIDATRLTCVRFDGRILCRPLPVDNHRAEQTVVAARRSNPAPASIEWPSTPPGVLELDRRFSTNNAPSPRKAHSPVTVSMSPPTIVNRG